MEQQALVVGEQVLVIFLFILTGYICVKGKVFPQEAGKYFANITLVLVLPGVIVDSYIKQIGKGRLVALGVAFLLAVLFHTLAIVASKLFIRKGDEQSRIDQISLVFSNCGFMGIPLIRAVVGEEGVFYAVAYISVFNILVWSYGVMTLTAEKRIEWRKIVFNPGLIGFVIGFSLYLLAPALPVVLTEAIGGISLLNTPLSMITTGIFLAEIDLGKTLRQLRLYLVSAGRLLLLPLAMIVVVKLMGVAGWLPEGPAIVMSLMLACACPCATTVALLPSRFGMDSEYGAKVMGMTTLLSILTLPLINYLTNLWLV